jgi:hypothetical protein
VDRSARRLQVRGVQRGAQRRGQGDASVHGPEVCVEQSRVVGEAVVVQLDQRDAARAEGLDDLLHLRCGHDEVAVDGGLAATHGLEVDPGGHAGRRGQDVPVVSDGVLAGRVATSSDHQPCLPTGAARQGRSTQIMLFQHQTTPRLDKLHH